MSSAIVSDFFYVTHEMVTFKTRVIEKFKSESTVELYHGMKNPLNHSI